MPSRPYRLIQLDCEYPCPCRCEGMLIHLALTEALGCFECQRIFILVDGGRAIANLAANSSRRKCWRWTGEEWYLANGQWYRALVVFAVFVILAMLGIGLFYAVGSAPDVKSLLRLIQVSVILMLPLVLWALWSH